MSKRKLINKKSHMSSSLIRYNFVLRVSLVACFVAFLYAWTNSDWDRNAPFKFVLYSHILSCDHNKSLNLDVSKIKIYIFDFQNNFSKSFLINDAAKKILEIKNLDKTKRFVMFVGGFTSHINHALEQQMRAAYKNYPNSYLIMPDHSEYTSNSIGNIVGYERSVTHIYYIGKALGKMLADLSEGGISSKNIHCIGHSLGGQILGHLGTAYTNITGEKLSRITALDPAGPCFTSSAVENQVRSGVADYVEIYHCNSGTLGSSSFLGDVDFLVNKNGEMQPECSAPIVPILYASSKAASCNHRVCVDLWTASVKYPCLFIAYSCDSYEDFRDGKCESKNMTVAGSGNPGRAYGKYFFSTTMYDLKAII